MEDVSLRKEVKKKGLVQDCASRKNFPEDEQNLTSLKRSDNKEEKRLFIF